MDKLENGTFRNSMNGVKVPVLVLDEKWHHLFAKIGKPPVIERLEKEVDQTLAKQGRINDEIKELKKAKNTLMKSIVENMEGTEESADNLEQSKKLDENKRLIDEINQKLEDAEDALLEVPREITAANEQLMLETMAYCYQLLRDNEKEIQNVTEWITQIRRELKINIINKQNKEHNNHEIYEYMHDIFGAAVIDIFDLKYDSNESVEK